MTQHILRHGRGCTFFFTIRLADPSSNLLTRDISALRRAMRATKQRHPFQIDAIVVLPSMIHTIWTLPDGDINYPNRIGMLKSRFSRAQPMPAFRTPTQIKRGEKGIWQRRSWEHQIRDAADLARHRALIYQSPVDAGLCATPQAWPHTSLHRDRTTATATPKPIAYDKAPLHFTPPFAHRYRDDVQRIM